MPDRPLSARKTSTFSAYPWATAIAACWIMNDGDWPPSWKSMTKRSWGSASVVATAWLDTESFITLKLTTPSTSDSGSPASSAAARVASVARSSTDRPDALLSAV